VKLSSVFLGPLYKALGFFGDVESSTCSDINRFSIELEWDFIKPISLGVEHVATLISTLKLPVALLSMTLNIQPFASRLQFASSDKRPIRFHRSYGPTG
jgi:hypothetical protein